MRQREKRSHLINAMKSNKRAMDCGSNGNKKPIHLAGIHPVLQAAPPVTANTLQTIRFLHVVLGILAALSSVQVFHSNSKIMICASSTEVVCITLLCTIPLLTRSLSLFISWSTAVSQRSTKTPTARVRTPSPPIRHVDRRPRGLSVGPWPPSIIIRGPGGHPPFLARRPSRE